MGETYTLVRLRLGHAAAHEFLQRVRASDRTARTFVAEAWEYEAENILAQFDDQDFSFVDATSFVVMRRLGLTQAFAFDDHFSVAGFELVTRG